MIKAGIINIGDELLIGQTVNTNATFIGKSLCEAGIEIEQSITIRDDKESIIKSLNLLIENIDLILITGGLGPTNDDITKNTLVEFFNTRLVLNEKVLTHVKGIFDAMGKAMVKSNLEQAMIPENAVAIYNQLGTAPGMWFEQDGKIIISLPGVPYEMKAMMTHEIMPRLTEQYHLEGSYFQTVILQGIEESFLAEKIQDWENQIYNDDLHLAYLPSPGLIRLRLTSSKGRVDKEKITHYFSILKNRFPQFIYGEDDISIFQVVGNLLKERKATLGTVESCTGGGIAQSFVAFPGASNFFSGSLVTYSNALKIKLAHVSASSLEKQGAVSEEVAKEMALGGKKTLQVDYCIAVTGIAGPDGGTVSKPVGTVWIAVATPHQVFAHRFLFGENRERNLTKTQLSAANFLRNILLENRFCWD